jgi:hypothetical protein
MKKLQVDIVINTSREQVWDAVVDDRKFRLWTSVFQPTSYFEGGWNKGDAIRFLAINEAGQKEGMVSEIAESRHPEYLSIRHLGFIYDGVDDTTSNEIKSWAPSYENYSLEKLDDQKTRFVVDMDLIDDYYDMFLDLWPKALAKLKEVSEENA